jgi:hypothetical protein
MAKTLCFDLDGTLCTNTFGDYELAEPFGWAIARVNALARAGNRIVILTARGFVTGREWSELTRAQLDRWGVHYDELVFGKPSADVYVDDRAVHTDAWQAGDGFDPPGFAATFDARCRPVRTGAVLPAVLPPAVTCVVETGRTFAGRPLRLREHVRRLQAVAADAGLTVDTDAEDVTRCARANLLDWRDDVGGDVVYALALMDAPAVAQLDLIEDGRFPVIALSRRLLPEVARGLVPRTADRGGEVRIRAEIADRGWPRHAWPLRRAADGSLTDAIGGQLGCVRDGALRLQPVAGRPSVAAEWLGTLARRLGTAFEVGPLDADDVAEADEVLLAGMPFCVLPVAMVDGLWADDGATGELTMQLREAWSAEVDVDLAAQTTDLVRRAAQTTAVPVP